MKTIIQEYGMTIIVVILLSAITGIISTTVLPTFAQLVPDNTTPVETAFDTMGQLSSTNQPNITLDHTHLYVGDTTPAISLIQELKDETGQSILSDFTFINTSYQSVIYKNECNGTLRIRSEFLTNEGLLDTTKEQTYVVTYEFSQDNGLFLKQSITVLVTRR